MSCLHIAIGENEVITRLKSPRDGKKTDLRCLQKKRNFQFSWIYTDICKPDRDLSANKSDE